MKKILSVLVVVAIVVASCSKEKKLNKKLDGEWTVVTFDGVAPTSGTSIMIKFEKDKKEGKYTLTQTDPSGTDTQTGTYVLIEDEKIVMTETGTTDKDTSVVKDYSKTDLTLTDTDGTSPIVLKKN
jgi:hypothetical protein